MSKPFIVIRSILQKSVFSYFFLAIIVHGNSEAQEYDCKLLDSLIVTLNESSSQLPYNSYKSAYEWELGILIMSNLDTIKGEIKLIKPNQLYGPSNHLKIKDHLSDDIVKYRTDKVKTFYKGGYKYVSDKFIEFPCFAQEVYSGNIKILYSQQYETDSYGQTSFGGINNSYNLSGSMHETFYIGYENELTNRIELDDISKFIKREFNGKIKIKKNRISTYDLFFVLKILSKTCYQAS